MREIRLSGSMSGDWKRGPIKGLPRQSSTLQRSYCGSGGVLCTNSAAVVHFPNIDCRKFRIAPLCTRPHHREARKGAGPTVIFRYLDYPVCEVIAGDASVGAPGPT
jgi:hypothetical protein